MRRWHEVHDMTLHAVLAQHDAACEAYKPRCKIQVACRSTCTGEQELESKGTDSSMQAKKLPGIGATSALQSMKLLKKGRLREGTLSEFGDSLRLRLFSSYYPMKISSARFIYIAYQMLLNLIHRVICAILFQE